MNGIPILTLLTVLPLVGAALALLAGRHARWVALATTLAGLVAFAAGVDPATCRRFDRPG